MLTYLQKIFEKMLFVRLNDILPKTLCFINKNTIFALTIPHSWPLNLYENFVQNLDKKHNLCGSSTQ